jgi:hypothetical protein
VCRQDAYATFDSYSHCVGEGVSRFTYTDEAKGLKTELIVRLQIKSSGAPHACRSCKPSN